MTQPFFLPARMIAQISLTSRLGSIIRREPFISSCQATFMPIELSPGDDV
jgi:hypothetical protein